MSPTTTERQTAKSHARDLPRSDMESIAAPRPQLRPKTARLVAACIFWSLCLTLTAAGHRLYKATVALDRELSADLYHTNGAALNWVGHGSVEQFAKRIAPQGQSFDATTLTVLPNSWFLLGMVGFYTLLAAGLVWSGRWISNDGIQSLLGLFAGHFLWLGAIEFGLAAIGRRLGLAGSLEMVEGRLVGTHGGGILIQLSVVFLIPMLIGWTFHESNRCVVFQWFRRRLPLTRGDAPSGRVDNYAARTAIQYFMTVWFCYVAVLWLADPRLGAFGQYGLLATMIAIALGTLYMVWRTVKQEGRSQALRYSVSGAVVSWTGIEIAAAMRYFHEPWLSHSLASAAVWFGLSIGLTVVVWLLLTSNYAVPKNAKQAATAGAITLTCLTVGCGKPEPSATPSAARIESRLREYDSRIHPPPPTAHDGLLHALSSDDPATRAQAALAFGKSRRVNAAVLVRLRAIAGDDRFRLPQFAALAALRRLNRLTTQLKTRLKKLHTDPEWHTAAAFVGQ